jgi:hypothetical protein
MSFSKPAAASRRREVVDVAEPKKPDRRLDKLAHVRKQRLRRYERERNEKCEIWRRQRHELKKKRQLWRTQQQQAVQFWEEQRQAFFAMTISSGNFRAAKFTYQRMLAQAAQTHLEAREQAQRCRQDGKVFFAALRQVRQARLQQEKLDFMRDELRMLSLQETE